MLVSTFILLALIVSFSGCNNNEITFYVGLSKNNENNIKFEADTPVVVEQNKEKIENSELVFYKNTDGKFDNLYLNYSGDNIKNIVIKSKNKTFLYDDYKQISRPLDVLTFYYEPEKSKVDEYFNPERDLESLWDNGKFDDIKNVYLNGLSIYEINRFRKDSDKQIGYANTNLYTEAELKSLDNELYYLDQKNRVENTVVYTQIDLSSGYSKELVKDEKDIIVQGETVISNTDAEDGCFIYRYEKLFYNSQQKALQNKNSFDYSDLSGEVCYITVNYNDGSIQNFEIEIDFDSNGNIIALIR